MAQQRKSGLGDVGKAVLVLAAIALGIGLLQAAGIGEAPPAPPPPALLSAAERAECNAALAKAEAAQLIRQRPTATRINVDDGQWAQLPADLKEKILAAVSCAALGRWQPLDISEGPVVAYGWRSGKRVAMLTSVGVVFE